MAHILARARLVGEFLFPSGCCLCGTMLTGTKEIRDGLCEDCGKNIQIEEGERCLLCGRPLISENDICLACRKNIHEEQDEGCCGKKPAYDRLFSLFPYTGRYRHLLWAFKYGKSAGAAHFMADKLLTALEIMNVNDPVLVPVPPRPGKIRNTGWDQIDFLSRIVQRRSRHPVSRCLVRLAQDSQKSLKKEDREVNLAGKIRFRGSGGTAKKAPPLCVLFDDVITTGSTMDACAAALRTAGAEKVYGICLVYD